VICNTGDDAILHGLYVSPDIDTITYTLAGLSDPSKGWGIAGDTFAVLEQLRRLGNEAWFNLGDKDLATHITRTRLLNEGWQAERDHRADAPARSAFNRQFYLCPMTAVETRVTTAQGELSFQEYFVKERWSREVSRGSFRRR
jgi:LPPG:FO 2-phospho-L-lactate transferase